MKLLIVAPHRDRYPGDRRSRRFPALSAIHLAGLAPRGIDVRVVHEGIAPLDISDVGADLVALTATTADAPRMYELGDRLRARGHTVVMGGPHASLVPEEAARHADAVAVGEAERGFPRMIDDFGRGRLARFYRDPEGLPLDGLPTPRYDLLEEGFPFRAFVQATRGCPHHCTFCTLKALDRSYRTRPVAEVVRDIEAAGGRSWLQRKFVWFWDDNLTADRDYARALFRAVRPLRRWWWTQASIDVADDPDLVRLAAESGCLAVFVGIESFSADNLLSVGKRQNRVDRYRRAIGTFHRFGIAVHAGLIVGLDGDTVRDIRLLPEAVAELGIDLPFVNVLTPFPGTPLRRKMAREDRLLPAGWERHNAAGVTFVPRRMTPAELEEEYWAAHHSLYAPGATARRIGRTLGRLRLSTVVLNSYVNLLMSVQNVVNPDAPWVEDSVQDAGRRLEHAS